MYIDDRVPGAGSFIRPAKKTDKEMSFLDAVRGKYASGHNEYEKLILDSSGKEIERIGFDKIEQQQRCQTPGRVNYSNLNELAMVVLDNMVIRYANPFTEIERTCSRITSLDLSRNLIESLSTVAEICRPLRLLRSLRLTGNRFSQITLKDELSSAFHQIEWLALNMCALYWEEASPICLC
jgi:hypothetical protein